MLLPFDQSPAFLDGYELIGTDFGEPVDVATRPADFDLIYLLRFSQTKMLAQVALRKVTRTAQHFPGLPVAAGGNIDPRANGRPIGPGSDRLYCQPLVTT